MAEHSRVLDVRLLSSAAWPSARNVVTSFRCLTDMGAPTRSSMDMLAPRVL